ncbi:MAG: formate dehydrogenase iron-sulfur subunit [Pseudonocardiales bacterium]|nr:formate dehydrogenase iron-sulfur subunit [Pseudonocardiales bacterium]
MRAPATERSVHRDAERMGFFTDTTVCIGCKACEVACKQWNDLVSDGGSTAPGGSYDHTKRLSASTWRHVRFVEEFAQPTAAVAAGDGLPDLVEMAEAASPPLDSWLFMSDVCKHCTNAGCMDACPTGALVRTEFDTVVVQADVCNGCGYCIPACPFGVIDRRTGDPGTKNVGIAQKCTLCYDRLESGHLPACAQACPTESIQFGDLDELRVRAQARVDALHEAGVSSARLYLDDPNDGIGGAGAFFLLQDDPEVYGLPPDPVVTTRDLPQMWQQAGLAAVSLLAGAVAAFVGRKR